MTLREMVSEYTVSAYPDPDSINADSYNVRVVWMGHNRWAVLRGDGSRAPALDIDGRWHHQPLPSEREEEWLARHRFDVDTALRLARDIAPKLTLNGLTAAGCWEWEQNQARRSS